MAIESLGINGSVRVYGARKQKIQDSNFDFITVSHDDAFINIGDDVELNEIGAAKLRDQLNTFLLHK